MNRSFARPVALLGSMAMLWGCDNNPAHQLTAPDAATMSVPVITRSAIANMLEEGWEGGALVRNPGEGKPDAFCFFGGGAFFTMDAVVARSPSGNWTLTCRFENLPPVPAQQQLTGWLCSIIGDPSAQTHHSTWVRNTSGTAHLDCHFSDKPIPDAAVMFSGTAAAAQQGGISLPLNELPGQQVSGEAVGGGLGCAPLGDLSGRVVVIERGVCPFTTKISNALDAGAVAVIVYNSAAFGDQIIVMGGSEQVLLPAVFVARSTGLALLDAAPAVVTLTYCARSASCRGEF